MQTRITLKIYAILPVSSYLFPAANNDLMPSKILLSLGLLPLLLLSHTNHPKPVGGFALIELFTSEGCSSCPPADELTASLPKSYPSGVYLLSFHVDYWDRLGWKDAFSSADWSQRQSQYAAWLHQRSVYTPQVVVNGQQQFVGSDENKLRKALKDNLDKPATATLELKDVSAVQDKLSLQYAATGAGNNAVLVLALVQPFAQTAVKRGENGGRTLSHVQVVRTLRSIPLKKSGAGTARIELPADAGAKGLALIAFVQDTGSGAILAAAKHELSGLK